MSESTLQERKLETPPQSVRIAARRRYLAEVLGVYILVFTGTGAIVINDVSGGVVTHPGIALVFGLVITAMIYALGEISGAHLNPAVTLAFAVAGRFPYRQVIPYIISQCLGGILASATLRVLFLEHSHLGATLPAGPWWQSWILELILTAILMFVILNVTTGAQEKGLMAGVAIGAVVALEALFAGPICGASMNPARSLAPALVSGHLADLWIYLVSTPLGALLGLAAFRGVWDDGPRRTQVVS